MAAEPSRQATSCPAPRPASPLTPNFLHDGTLVPRQRLSTASDSSETTLNARAMSPHAPSTSASAYSTSAGTSHDTASFPSRSALERSLPPGAYIGAASQHPAAVQPTVSMASPPLPFPNLVPAPTLAHPMGTAFAPNVYFQPPHSKPPQASYAPSTTGLSAHAAPFIPQAFPYPVQAPFNYLPLSHPPYAAAPPAGYPVAFPQQQTLPPPFVARPRAASDRPAPASVATEAVPRANSFSATGSPQPAARTPLPSKSTAILDVDEDNRPLAHQRYRNGSLVSTASGTSTRQAGSRMGSSSASSRSITPTPDAADAPQASMPTARGMTAVSAGAQSPSLTHHRSAPSLARPSPLSQERLLDDMLEESPQNRRNGFGRLKMAFSVNTSDSSSTVSSPRGHEKGSASVTSNASFSSTSTSPPRTPPDPAVLSPFIYSNPDAEHSTATLPSDASPPLQPKQKKSLFSSRMNASTDNISISSTVSSASMMIRKIGSFGGKLTKRGSLSSIGSMFRKDQDRDPDAQSEAGGLAAKLKKKDRKKSNLATASLTQVHAEPESPPRGGLTPAKALVKQQQQLYAEQEAAEAAKLKEAEEKEARLQQLKDDKRLKAIEREKEKQKGRRIKKWGLGSFGGGSSISYASARNLISQEDLTEFGAMADEADISHVEHAAPMLASPRVPVPSFLEDRSARNARESASFSEATSQLFNDRWASSSENVASYFEEDSASHFESPETTDTEGSVFKGRAKAAGARSPLGPPRAVKGILKSSRSGSSTPATTPIAHFERARSNSYDTPGTPNSVNLPQGISVHPDHFTVSPAGTSGSNSPVSPPAGQAMYHHPALNVSAPVLHPQPHAPFMINRSVTAPPGKRLAFAPNLSIHTTWPAADYDRRSEPATCNKLTPALAQRIKEELNAYKLNEMDVHHTSRIYTHFFP